ncbi:MAG: RsmE family RNA methyltransferase [Planctomycetota bacterium]
MSHRFYLPSLSASRNPPAAEGEVEHILLTGDQAHHAISVMRFRVGDQLVLFDGKGLEAKCELVSTEKKSIRCRPVDFIVREPALPGTITLAVALPKNERQKFLIEKLVETGVHQLIPLTSQRGVAAINDKVRQRLHRQIIEATKQCERAWLMEVGPSQTLDELASQASSSRKYIADPYQGESLCMAEITSEKPVVVAVGPEGGFTDEELALAIELGFQPVRMGPTVLRVETAAIAAAILLGIGRH